MDLIAAADKNWAIGKEGGLLCHLPGDLKYFKEMTTGKTVVMGRKTLESLPGGRPLQNRQNVVLTGDLSYQKEGCIIVHSVKELLETVNAQGSEDGGVMVMGGASVYRQLLPYCQNCYITRLEADFEADVYMPDLDRDRDFVLAWESRPQEENGVTYRFTRYERMNDR